MKKTCHPISHLYYITYNTSFYSALHIVLITQAIKSSISAITHHSMNPAPFCAISANTRLPVIRFRPVKMLLLGNLFRFLSGNHDNYYSLRNIHCLFLLVSYTNRYNGFSHKPYKGNQRIFHC